MLAKLHTFSLLGIEAMPVDVEVDVSPAAMPKTILVGLPEAAVQGEHAPRGTGDRQLRVPAAVRPRGDQSGPGGTSQAGRHI